MIKYKFAYDFNQHIIDIKTLAKANKKIDKFECLSCGNEMVPVLGEKRVKHFRHKVITEVNCSPETYLHKLAKLKFYETYQNCLNNKKSFNIKILMPQACNHYENEFLRTCPLESKEYEFDLTKYFKEIYPETKENSFIADVLLEADNKEKLFFEVVVTHYSSEEKINSKYRIIEFIVKTEEDIEKIESCLLVESETIQFFNFNRNLKIDSCEGECSQGNPRIVPYAECILEYTFFVIYESGKSEIYQEPLEQINSLIQKSLYVEYIPATNLDRADLFRSKVVESYQKGLKIENCFLCRYHSIWYGEGAVRCRFLEKVGDSNTAVDCKHFRPDSKVFSKYHNSHNQNEGFL